MPRTARLVLSALTGLAGGAAIVFLVVMACVVLAFAAETDVAFPGLFRAWFSTENDLPAISFTPNGTGMIIAVLLISGATTAVTAWRTRPRRPGDDSSSML